MFTVRRDGEEIRVLTHDNDNCISCGLCVGTCPTDSLKLGPIVPIARGLIDLEKVSINKDSCVLCGLCSVSCPFNAMSLVINSTDIKDLENYPKWETLAIVDEDDCIYCGRCYNVCPQDSILFERQLPARDEFVRGIIEINDEDCIFCRMCVEMCPAQAIEVQCNPSASNEVLDNVITVDNYKCVYCGVCKRACPEGAIQVICSTCMESDDFIIPPVTGETSIIENTCVNCSWCAETCPKDCINVVKPFSGAIELIETDEAKCKGESCHACQDVCSCNAIEIIDNISVTNPTFCNLCGACVPACPQHIRHINRTSMKLTNINSKAWKEILNKIID